MYTRLIRGKEAMNPELQPSFASAGSQLGLMAGKVFSKLNIHRNGNTRQDGHADVSEIHDAENRPHYQQSSATAAPGRGLFVIEYETEISHRSYSPLSANRYAKANGHVLPNGIEDGFSFEDPRVEQNEGFEVAKPVDQLAVSPYQYLKKEL